MPRRDYDQPQTSGFRGILGPPEKRGLNQLPSQITERPAPPQRLVIRTPVVNQPPPLPLTNTKRSD